MFVTYSSVIALVLDKDDIEEDNDVDKGTDLSSDLINEKDETNEKR